MKSFIRCSFHLLSVTTFVEPSCPPSPSDWSCHDWTGNALSDSQIFPPITAKDPLCPPMRGWQASPPPSLTSDSAPASGLTWGRARGGCCCYHRLAAPRTNHKSGLSFPFPHAKFSMLLSLERSNVTWLQYSSIHDMSMQHKRLKSPWKHHLSVLLWNNFMTVFQNILIKYEVHVENII